MTLKTSSTIPFFADALLEALRARAGLTTVPMMDGVPPPGTFEGREWIAVLDCEFEQEPRGMDVTTRPRLELYRQTVLITVTVAGRETQAVANARAWELFTELELAIRDNPTLTGYYTADGQIVAVQVGTGSFTKRATDLEREAAIEVELSVRARI